jgi:hypothetical protein
LNLR